MVHFGEAAVRGAQGTRVTSMVWPHTAHSRRKRTRVQRPPSAIREPGNGCNIRGIAQDVAAVRWDTWWGYPDRVGGTVAV